MPSSNRLYAKCKFNKINNNRIGNCEYFSDVFWCTDACVPLTNCVTSPEDDYFYPCHYDERGHICDRGIIFVIESINCETN